MVAEDGKASLQNAECPEGVESHVFDRGVMSIQRAVRRRTPDIDEPFVTEFLSGRYDVLRTAVGDMAVGEPDSPSAGWRNDINNLHVTDEAPVLQFAERAAILAEAGVTQHLKLLAKAYWDNLGNSDAEDPSDWPAESIYPPARATLEGMAIIGWLLKPDVRSTERVQRVCEMMLWTSKEFEPLVRKAGVSVGKNPNGALCVDRGTGPKALNWRRMILDVYEEDMYKTYMEWSKFSHNDPLSFGKMSYLAPVDSQGLFRLTSSVREDVHLIIAGTLASAIGRAEARKSTYFGRPDAVIRETCQVVIDQCRVGYTAAIQRVSARKWEGNADE